MASCRWAWLFRPNLIHAHLKSSPAFTVVRLGGLGFCQAGWIDSHLSYIIGTWKQSRNICIMICVLFADCLKYWLWSGLVVKLLNLWELAGEFPPLFFLIMCYVQLFSSRVSVYYPNSFCIWQLLIPLKLLRISLFIFLFIHHSLEWNGTLGTVAQDKAMKEKSVGVHSRCIWLYHIGFDMNNWYLERSVHEFKMEL